MNKGELALVLHAHLPYVRSSEPGSLEEDWYFQALMECYLPLLATLEKSSKSKDQDPKITIGLSPTLLSLFIDQELNNRFPSWLKVRIDLLATVPKEQKVPADHLSNNLKSLLKQWNSSSNLINRFAELQKSQVVDLLTCAATHGYLPLLREHPGAIRGQLRTAVREHLRLFKVAPLGIWLPECAYYEGLDHWIMDAGLKYAVLDGHGLLHASPRPRYGVYAPICTKNGVAFFGRDSESTLPVWSAREGFPGDPLYREFHKDIGWELSADELSKIGVKEPRPLGLKLYRVTEQTVSLKEKEIYEPSKANIRAKEHANNYLQKRRFQLDRLSNAMDISPLLVAPFDAELFGHWWFEGTVFLSELFLQAKSQGINFTRLCDFLYNEPKIQLCNPSPSSWGKGGFHDYWLNERNAWIVPQWSKASKAFIDICAPKDYKKNELQILQQAARELLLSQSSDWSFILRADTTTQLARDRINIHLRRFWELISIIKGKEDIPLDFIDKLEKEDGLFPLISPDDWTYFDP